MDVLGGDDRVLFGHDLQEHLALPRDWPHVAFLVLKGFGGRVHCRPRAYPFAVDHGIRWGFGLTLSYCDRFCNDLELSAYDRWPIFLVHGSKLVGCSWNYRISGGSAIWKNDSGKIISTR